MFLLAAPAAWAQNYKDASLPAEKRAELLLAQMTLGEKAAQLKNTSHALIKPSLAADGKLRVNKFKKLFPQGVGGLNLDRDLLPEEYLQLAGEIQKYNQSMRLPIPALFVGEGLHGFMSNHATVFPQAIALGSTWDVELIQRVYDATAREASARGVKQMFSPVLDLGREPRFGRIEEMFSEDTYLTGEYARAAVKGLQGPGLAPDAFHVAATVKHFVGHGVPEGGRNVAPVNLSTYDLMNEHLLPFEKAIQAGALGVMPSYNEINGLPNHANAWLLQDVLRGRLQFAGVIAADQNAIDEMHRTHQVVPSLEDACVLALHNGIDVDVQYFRGAYDEIESLVREGKLKEEVVDQAVRRVLTLKFKLGLFEQGDYDLQRLREVTNCAAHKKLAQEAAEKSAVLLKNEGGVLPLKAETLKAVAVIGPLATGVHLGGYTVEPNEAVDVLEGITAYADGRFKVEYAEGCRLAKVPGTFWGERVHEPVDEAVDAVLIKQAVEVARRSDVIVLALGETVSFSREAWGENHLGDRDSLDLLGRQEELVEALLATGKPIVAIMFGGRPLSFNSVTHTVPAIVQVYYPGQEGGHALARLLFGQVNFTGKLATTIPRSVGQIPCYYSRKPSRMRSYIYYKGLGPLYAFGHGLSYTTFAYADLNINKNEMGVNDAAEVSITVANTGKVAGEEIVQLYIRDVVSTGVRPVLELKDFKRVPLQPGEKKTVTFTIDRSKLEYYNPQLKKVVEPGEFEIGVGRSSEELEKVTLEVK